MRRSVLVVLCIATMLAGCASSLMNATRYGSPTDVQHSLSNRVDVDEKNLDGITPLMYAAAGQSRQWNCHKGLGGICQVTLDFATEEDLQKVYLLLKAGADINARDNKGRSVLSYGVRGGNPRIVSHLIKKGAKVDNDLLMETMLWHGKFLHKYIRHAKRGVTHEKIFALVDRRYGQIARILVKNGADPNAQDKKGRNAFDYFLAGTGRDYINSRFTLRRFSQKTYLSPWWQQMEENVANLLSPSSATLNKSN